MRRLPLLAVLAVTAGCGTYVTVRHVLPPRQLAGGEASRMERVAVLMELDPPEGPAGVLGRAAKNVVRNALGDAFVSRPLAREEARALLAAVAGALRSPSSGVVALAIRDVGATLWLDGLRPTVVLRLIPSALEAAQEEVVERYRDGGTTKTVRSYKLAARFTMAYRLAAWPGLAPLASREMLYAVNASAEQPVRLEPWLDGQQGLRQAWLRDVRADLLPVAVWPSRLIRKGRTPALKAGRAAARAGRWEDARARWMEEDTRTGDWRALWNLGVAAERDGDWQGARGYYERAAAACPDVSPRATLGSYLAQMARVFTDAPAPNPEAGAWFAETLAVLPFANNTNNVDAPFRMRDLAARELQAKGYPVLPPEDTARKLRDAGVTQGEHLKAVSPAAVASAAGARRLLTGTVEAFKELNLGMYQVHVVSASFRLLDETGRVLWQATGAGFQEIVTDPRDAGKAFLLGLAGTALEKMTRSYLEGELRDAVATGLESLPTAPAAY